MKQNNFENKTIRCGWCSMFDDDISICSVRKIKLKANSKRRCSSFVPDYNKIDKHINKGKDIKVTRRPDGYFLKGSARKKHIKELVAKEVREATQRNEAHPLTGSLGNIASTAGSD